MSEERKRVPIKLEDGTRAGWASVTTTDDGTVLALGVVTSMALAEELSRGAVRGLELRVLAGPAACRECREGKHGNCDGDTWDEEADEPAPCPCAAVGHAGTPT